MYARCRRPKRTRSWCRPQWARAARDKAGQVGRKSQAERDRKGIQIWTDGTARVRQTDRHTWRHQCSGRHERGSRAPNVGSAVDARVGDAPGRRTRTPLQTKEVAQRLPTLGWFCRVNCNSVIRQRGRKGGEGKGSKDLFGVVNQQPFGRHGVLDELQPPAMTDKATIVSRRPRGQQHDGGFSRAPRLALKPT